MELNLPPETDAVLNQHARALGMDKATYILKTLRQQIAEQLEDPSLPIRHHEQWFARLKHWSDSCPVSNHSIDDSRESIYEGRGW